MSRIPATWRRIVGLAWPAMATGFVRVSMRTIDLLVVGVVVGAVGVAAVGIADAFTRLVLMLALGLSAGTMATVSQRFGAGDRRGADAAATQTGLIALALGGVATVAGLLAAEPFFALLGAEPAVVEQGSTYLRIVIATAVPRVLAIMLSRVLQAAGDTRTPMVVRIAATVVNIGLTVVLVPGLGPAPEMGVVGAAIGTATGNVLSGGALSILLLSGRLRAGFSREGVRDLGTGLTILRIGAPQVAERSLFSVADIPMNALVLHFGTVANAGFQIGRRMHLFARIPGVGVGIAGGHFVGANIGRGDLPASERYGSDAIRLAGLIGLVGCGVLFAFAEPVGRAFGGGADPALLDAMAVWIRVYAVATIFLTVYSVLRYAMQGAGETRLPLYTSAVGILGFMLGFSALASIGFGWGVAGIYVGVVLDGLVRTTLLGRLWRQGRWRRAVPGAYVPTPAPPAPRGSR